MADDTTIEVEPCEWLFPPSCWLVARQVGESDWFLSSRSIGAFRPPHSWMRGIDTATFRYPDPEAAKTALEELTAAGIILPAGVIRIIPILENTHAP